MRKYLLFLIAACGLIAPAGAQAHTGQITISCPTPTALGQVVFEWQNFPRDSNAWGEVRLDGVRVYGNFTPISIRGKAVVQFQVPADGRQHTVEAKTEWTADGGGRAVRTASCTLPVNTPIPPCPVCVQCPPGPAGPQGPPGITTVITRTEIVIQERQCVSRRLQRATLRKRYPGFQNQQGFTVVGIDNSKTKMIAGVLERGVWTGMDALGNNIATDWSWTRDAAGDRRVRLWIDTRGRTFTGLDNELRTTVWLRVRLDNGRLASRRVIYRSAVCRSEQGNPNDENARSPEIPGV